MPPLVPGAQGYNINQRGAYAGSATPDIIIVNSLADTRTGSVSGGVGSGTLRFAVEWPNPRIIIPSVGGYIDATDGNAQFQLANPYCNIYGQTAPNPGLHIRKYGFDVTGHHLLLQHFSIRPGEFAQVINSVCGLIAYGSDCHDILCDHMSFAWGQDENIAADTYYTGDMNFTCWRCMTYENLDFPVSSPLNASHGFLVQSACKKVVMGQCFAGTNRERNPYWQGGTSSLKMNSISFNAYGPWFNLGTCFDIVGNPRTNLPWFHTSLFNVDIAGNNSYDSPAGSGDVCQWEYNSGGGISPGCKIYRNGNIFINDYGFPFQTVINQMGSAVTEFASAIPELPLTDFSPLPTTDLEAFIYANVGARPLNRYPHDQRALDNSAVRTSTAGYISDQSQVGGYTSLSPTSRTLTIPGDPHFVTSSGYTNIELWAQQYAAALEPSNSSINQSRTLIGGIVR